MRDTSVAKQAGVSHRSTVREACERALSADGGVQRVELSRAAVISSALYVERVARVLGGMMG